MKHSLKHKRIFSITLLVILLAISAGFFVAVKTSGSLFSKGTVVIRNIEFESISFAESFLKAILIHLGYTVCILLFYGRFPGATIPGIYLLARCISMGVCVGLASLCCDFPKATGICLAVFLSNVLVFPLYVLMYILSVNRIGEHKSEEPIKDYLSFAAKIVTFFAVLCAAEFVQTIVGVIILTTLF